MRIYHFWAEMTKLPQIRFFSEKPWFPCLTWHLSLWKIGKQSLQWIQSCEDVPFWVLNDLFAPNKNFFGKAINVIFMYLLAPFIVQNLKKILRANPELWDVPFLGPKWPFARTKSVIQSYEMHHFWAQNGPFAPQKEVFGKKSLVLFSSTYWPLLLRKILKKSYSRSRVTRMHHFWAHNGPFAQTRIFSENLLINLTPFIPFIPHSSKSDIDLLMKY